MKFPVLIFVALLAGASNVSAQSDRAQSDRDVLDEKDVPELVKKQSDCGPVPSFTTRRPFAGGFVFALPCPGNHANDIKALVYAKDANGAHARLIKFPTPNAKNKLEEISNVRWFSKTSEVSHLFVNPEERICRVESRWTLRGADAVLKHWRQTRDCNGHRGWITLVNRK